MRKINNINKYLILILACYFVSLFSFSQGTYLEKWLQDHDKQVAVSPNAAALGIYGSIPVGHYTGVPNINIPIYEIDFDGKKIPISLSYHASGIKVAQEASWVGLGWTLNIGGGITRQVRDLDDFEQNQGGYYFIQDDFKDIQEEVTITNPDVHGRYKIIEPYINRVKDSEPDIFQFNFANYSGTFFINKLGENGNSSTKANAQILNREHYLDISFDLTARKWIALDGDGFKYYFGTIEETTSLSAAYDRVLENSMDAAYNQRKHQPTVATCWMLDSIISPLNNKIIFNYEFESILTVPSLSEESGYMYAYQQNNNGVTGMTLKPKYKQIMYNRSRIKQAKLKSISFANGTISLETSKRVDIYGDGSKVDFLLVKNDNETIKKIAFNYKYIGNQNKPEECRLLLESLKEEEGNKTHIFSYYGKIPVAKNSLLTDLWGYYSDVNTSGLLTLDNAIFVTTPTHNFPSGGGYIQLMGNNRYSILSGMTAFTLNSITYPTGGKTIFDYEGHKVDKETVKKMDDLYFIKHEWVDGGVSLVNEKIVASGTSKLIGDAFDLNDSVNTLTIKARLHRFNQNLNGGAYCHLKLEKYNPTTKQWEGLKSEYIDGLFIQLQTERNIDYKYILPKGKYRQKLEISRATSDYHYFLDTKLYKVYDVSYNELEDGFAGLRIKKITDFVNEDGKARIKNFRYEKNGESTGKMFRVPDYFREEEKVALGINSDHTGLAERGEYIVGRTFSSYRLPGSSNEIGYSYVEEISDNGKVVYEFYNSSDIIKGSKYPFPGFPSKSNLSNGLPIHTSFYDVKNQLLSKTSYDYKSVNLGESIKGFQYYINRNQANPFDIYYAFVKFYEIEPYRNYLNEESVTTYYPETKQSSSITKTYHYNELNKLVNSITTINSKNQSLEEKILYPSDYTDPVYKNMVSCNLVNKPVEKIAITNKQEIARYKTSYYKDATKTKGLIVPQKVETSTTGISGLKAEVTYDLYDSLGNLLQKTNKDGVVTSYLWSYNGQYPVAEVVNANYDQIKAILGVTPESISSSLSPDMTKINPLREKLSEAQVTTYKYKPLIGMTEKTDPRGVTTYYDYDSFGRLKEIYIKENGQKRIIESYNYHYQNQ